MIRPALTEIGLFLVPFVLYVLFLAAIRVQVLQARAWTPPRVAALLIASIILLAGSFFALAQFSGAPPGSTYVPAHIQGGKLVPGATR